MKEKRRDTKQSMKFVMTTILIVVAGVGLWGLTKLPWISNLLGTSKPLCKHCNVVMLSVDVLRASQLPCYGYTRNTTPNLCSFAKKGAIFTNAHSQSTWTYPDQASILTSLYPTSHGLEYPENGFLHPSIVTLAQRYQKSGYFTVFIGDSHEDTTPINHGLARGFDKIVSTKNQSITGEAELWVSEIRHAETQKKPFFVYIYSKKLNAYMPWEEPITDFRFDPSYKPPQLPPKKTFNQEIAEEMRRSLAYARSPDTRDEGYDRLTRLITELDQADTLAQAKKVYNQLTGVEQEKLDRDQYQKVLRRDLTYLEYMSHVYDETLSRLDDAWKILFDTLNGPEHEKTIFVFFSDHGENLGDHGTIGHGMIPYDSLTHVPLIIRVPTVAPSTVEYITQLVDIYPTLLGLTGIRVPEKLAGHNLSPVFAGKSPASIAGTYAITELKGDYYYASIRTAQWRLLERTKDNQTTQELFDMINDPGEVQDVSRKFPHVTTELSTLMRTVMERQPTYPAVTNTDL